MSTSNLKARHYSALASRLRNLQANLTETEKQLEMMSDQLNSMARLGVGCGSQFMAVSRLLDVELMKATQEADQSQPSQQQSQSNYDESTANISRSQ
ncbi:hypothetical protein V866_004919 [Kwoniella sp. B9012]|uniref:Uncharacterized protein n=1 Tax=Kwoniella mangroviensis CBS 10435 TaxID=1331196 RepID=A0A1B9IM17_9TREE|nr:uncharacterized protein I203_07976 [Kwoniella mangroviensis CBS 8507]OCF56410.1 hypothetical protein L486_06354 [Kwoniella mangroviensis CBS 10435]OCF62995.1 hypothetical protein I203_07976 [Kwoniella mangroviensis CBS 8507]OCF79160.1 hypothetical protein I204_01107 [Kwoniella mangroviensis CBS 8886]